MKRANGEGHIRQRKPNLWEGQYTAGIDENGKPIKKSVYGKTQKEVAQKLTAITNDINTGLYIAPDKITVSEWFDLWLQEYNGSVKESTRTQYEYQFRVHIKPGIGSLKLQKISPAVLQKFINQSHENGLSPKSCRNLHGVLHKCFNQAVLCGYVKNNPVLAVQLPRVEKKEMLTLSNETLKLFLAEIKGKAHEDLFFVDVFTGLREGEIIGLTWDCIDFSKGIIRVEKQLKRKTATNNDYHFDTLKNGKTRIVTPAPFVFDVLRKVKAIQTMNQLKNGSAFSNPDNLVFTNETGKHIGVEALYKCFKKRVSAIGCPDMRFHDLRHTFATLSLQNGDDVKVLSSNLGHATVAFTLDVYGHVTEQMRSDSAMRMQKYYEAL